MLVRVQIQNNQFSGERQGLPPSPPRLKRTVVARRSRQGAEGPPVQRARPPGGRRRRPQGLVRQRTRARWNIPELAAGWPAPEPACPSPCCVQAPSPLVGASKIT